MAEESMLTRLTRWQAQVDRARRRRETWETRYRVKELEQFFLGQQTVDRDEIHEFWLNHFAATLATHKPTLLPHSTAFLVKPTRGRKPFGTFESHLQAAVLTAIAEQDDNLSNDASLA